MNRSTPLTTGLLTRRVAPGQRGVAYHFEVISATTGMRHPAFDLMDAHDLADELCLATCGSARIVKSDTDEVVGYRHYFHVSRAASLAYGVAMNARAAEVLR